MVIGLDIDGTINRHPAFFAYLSQALVRDGHQVVIITFREDRASAMQDLADWGITYSRLITWSFAKNVGVEMNAWKGRVCDEMKVELLFDDDPEVLRRLSPNVISMMVVDHESHDLARLCDGPPDQAA